MCMPKIRRRGKQSTGQHTMVSAVVLCKFMNKMNTNVKKRTYLYSNNLTNDVFCYCKFYSDTLCKF